MKVWGVQCAVKWCVCLTKPESQYCAVHATRGKDYKPSELKDGSGATAECDDCDGTGECADCYGQGTHECGHENCRDEHDCGACEGTGECQSCQEPKQHRGDLGTFDQRYVAFAFDMGCAPLPPAFRCPWDVS